MVLFDMAQLLFRMHYEVCTEISFCGKCLPTVPLSATKMTRRHWQLLCNN